MKSIVLAFSKTPFITSTLPFHLTQTGEMLIWLKKQGFEMQQRLDTYEILVKFERNNKTLEFIKTFLEPLVRHALPMESLKTIKGVRVVSLT